MLKILTMEGEMERWREGEGWREGRIEGWREREGADEGI